MSRIKGRVMNLERRQPSGLGYLFSPIPTNGMTGQRLLDAIERETRHRRTAEEWEAEFSPHRTKERGDG